jgi:hypothetical protein
MQKKVFTLELCVVGDVEMKKMGSRQMRGHRASMDAAAR